MRRLSALAACAVICAGLAEAQPTRTEVSDAMRKAATFMVEKASLHGGYVWAVSEDLSARWGEIPARPSQIWVQAGTPMVGMAFLDAYDVTRDRLYLDAARKAADALIFGQTPEGGWHYFIDFDPAGLVDWYKTRASQFKYGYEEFRHYYGNATNDDGVTSDATEFLLRFYATTLDAAYRAPLLKALDFALKAQYPNGGWPQRYPLRYDFVHDGLPDYTSYYTLNDGAQQGYVEMLVRAYRVLGDARYMDAARRGADFYIAAQGPEGQAAWAEQYGMDLKPIAARTHEPVGYVIRESRDGLRVLELFYALTGDARYLAPIPRCIAWFDRVNREAVELKRPPARYWQPGTNLPVYNVRTGAFNSEGYGLYEWTTVPPAGMAVKPAVDVAPIQLEFQAAAGLKTPEAREAYVKAYLADRRPAATAQEAAAIIKGLDARGAWVTDDVKVHLPEADAKHSGDTKPMRGIATAVFVRNLRALTFYLEALGR